MSPPLVLVHGLWDSPRLFRRLIQGLDQANRPLLAPHLPHGLGWVPLRQLAHRLDQHIQERFGPDTSIDLLGFSMGGVIGRIWLQELGGVQRTRRFFSVGSPQQGTLAAQLINELRVGEPTFFHQTVVPHSMEIIAVLIPFNPRSVAA